MPLQSTTRFLLRRRVVHATGQPAIFASATTTRLLGAHSTRHALQLRPLSSSTPPMVDASTGRDDERVNQGKEAIKITRFGMYVNLSMALSKGVLGVVSHSSALIADAAHSMSDLLSDFVTLWSVKVARLPPDPKHPYGYGKYEAVGSLSVGAILVVCGAGIGLDALHALQAIWADAGAASTAMPELSLPFLPDLEDRSRVSAKQLLEQEMRPYREIKRDVTYALAKIPEIVGTTHINTHWVPYRNGNGTVVDIAIIVQPDLTVGEAHGVARKARKAVEAISYVAEADIHLELQDSEHEGDMRQKRNEEPAEAAMG
ncbi:hypothetical protein ATCC90586_005714 [Pythium insidiosum]|nr:hypothetical protein ATCC90586_005714 [Pythium insidiosum]